MSRKILLSAFVLSAGVALLQAQTMVEYGVSAGRSGAAAGAVGPGRSATTIFDKINKSLGGAAKADSGPKTGSSSPAVAVSAVTPAAAPTPAEPQLPPDFTALATGMERADLLKKIGKPSMSMSSMESSQLVETYWYRGAAASVTVVLRDGKVAEITGAEKVAAK